MATAAASKPASVDTLSKCVELCACVARSLGMSDRRPLSEARSVQRIILTAIYHLRYNVLREKPNDRTKVEAIGTSDEQLRGVVFGDPVMHHMTLYARRVENLAFAAMTGKEIG